MAFTGVLYVHFLVVCYYVSSADNKNYCIVLVIVLQYIPNINWLCYR